MWAWIRSRSSPASHASSTSRASSSGVASAIAIRVGPWFEPLRKRRSPLTLAIHERRRTWRSPVRRCRASEVPPPSSASSTHTDVEVVERRRRPSARGHQSSGRSIVIVHSRSLAPAASGWSATWSTPPSGAVHRHRAGGVAVERGAQHEHRPLGRGLAAQRAQPGDPHRARLGHPHRPPDAAGVPVGVEAVPVLEHAGEVPLGGEVVGRAQVTSMARWCSPRARRASVTSKVCGAK